LVLMPEPEKAQVIRELTAFLDSRVAAVTELPKPVHPIRYQQGRVLFHRVGCVACHPPFEPADAVFELPGGEAGEAEDEASARPLESRVLVELVEQLPYEERTALLERILSGKKAADLSSAERLAAYHASITSVPLKNEPSIRREEWYGDDGR